MTAVHLRPSDEFTFANGNGDVLLIACGALAREIVDLIESSKWTVFDVACLPAKWHNRPELIAPGVREKIRQARGRYKKIFVVYGDCGSGGMLDKMLAEEGIERIEGPHCYSFLSGNGKFARNEEGDVTAFFLTDYLARHFEKLIWEGLGLKQHPELLHDYFGNYTKLVYLAQTRDEELAKRAMSAAKKLGLAYEYRYTGYGDLETTLKARAQRNEHGK
jgi:hypothetical protein